MATLKEFNESKKQAFSEIKKGSCNPFNVLNKLNKLAQKNDYCDGTAVRPIVEAFRNYCDDMGIAYNKRYAFSLDVFQKDVNGRFIIAVPVDDMVCVGSLMCGEQVSVDGKNVELLNGQPVVCKAVRFTSETALFNDICAVIKEYIKEQAQAAKEAAKSARESEKALKKAQNEVKKQREILVKEYNDGRISEAEFFTRMQTLKVA